MKEHHKLFLADIYLKYIGWTLSDKVSVIIIYKMYNNFTCTVFMLIVYIVKSGNSGCFFHY